MAMRGLSGVSRFLATRHLLALATALATMMTAAGAFPAIASASAAPHHPYGRACARYPAPG
jgi:hypothetical protein